MTLMGYDRWLEAPYQDARLWVEPVDMVCPYKDTDEDDLPEGVESHEYHGSCDVCDGDVCSTCNSDEVSTCGYGQPSMHLSCHKAVCRDPECWWR